EEIPHAQGQGGKRHERIRYEAGKCRAGAVTRQRRGQKAMKVLRAISTRAAIDCLFISNSVLDNPIINREGKTMKLGNRLTTCVAGAAVLAFAAGAFAQDDNIPQDKRWYIAPMLSYGFMDHDRFGLSTPGEEDVRVKNKDSFGVALAIGKPINSWLNLE